MDNLVFAVFGWLIQMDLIILMLLLAGILCLFIRYHLAGRRLLTTAAALTLFFGILPTGSKLIHFLEHRFPMPQKMDPDVKGIILLGGSFNLQLSGQWDRPVYNVAAGRIIDFVVLAQQYPSLPILFTGAGVGATEKVNESAYMQQLFQDLGVDLRRVTFEGKSKNTAENARFSYDLMRPKRGETWILVTSAYHMPRSIGLFRKAGWDVTAYPVDFHGPKQVSWMDMGLDLSNRLQLWSYGIREIGGMVTNYLAGRSDTLIPKEAQNE